MMEDQQYVEKSQSVEDQVVILRTPSLLQALTNPICAEFEELSEKTLSGYFHEKSND